MNVLAQMLPLVFLIGLGVVLQRLSYFEEVAFSRIQSFLLQVTIPCLLFTAFSTMRFGQGQVMVSVGMFLFMLLMLICGVAAYRLLPIRHDFFIFFFSAFGFGTVAFPVFVEFFGIENAAPMALLGIGHEVFIAGVLLPALQIFYGKRGARWWSAFVTPAMVMVFLGTAIGAANLTPVIYSNIIGAGLLDTIGRIGGLTLPFALILTGYRLRLSDRKYLKISALYAGIRLAVAIGLGVMFHALFLEPFTPGLPLLGHAFYTLILQHGPIVLLVYVARYRSIEDQIIANNAFVINMAAGIALFFLYMLIWL